MQRPDGYLVCFHGLGKADMPNVTIYLLHTEGVMSECVMAASTLVALLEVLGRFWEDQLKGELLREKENEPPF